MGRMHTRLSEDIETDLQAYLDAEGVDRRTAIRRLVAKGLETWRQEQSMESDSTGMVAQPHGSQQRRIERCGISLGSRKSEI